MIFMLFYLFLWVKFLISCFQASGNSTQRAFIQTALDHMKNHGIKITFSTQGIYAINFVFFPMICVSDKLNAYY